MKAKIKESARSRFTMDEGAMLKKINKKIKRYKLNDVVGRVLSIYDCPYNILQTNVVLGRNERANNSYLKHSGNLDIWITALAFSGADRQFVHVGFYLSDYWILSLNSVEEFRQYVSIDVYSPDEYELQIPNEFGEL